EALSAAAEAEVAQAGLTGKVATAERAATPGGTEAAEAVPMGGAMEGTEPAVAVEALAPGGTTVSALVAVPAMERTEPAVAVEVLMPPATGAMVATVATACLSGPRLVTTPRQGRGAGEAGVERAVRREAGRGGRAAVRAGGGERNGEASRGRTRW